MTQPSTNRTAFTLVELLVVIGIVAVLIAILLPALSSARHGAKSVACLSNLRQLATAAHAYAVEYQGHYPIAQYAADHPDVAYGYAWDFTLVLDKATMQRSIRPGLLWPASTEARVQQCPAFEGRSGTLMDPYTGYNYNTSFIGHGEGELIVAPAKVSQVRSPSTTALFGDGEWSGGANKFMRSPLFSPSDSHVGGRHAGAQGFRHKKRTNVAFCDGHAESLAERFTAGLAAVAAGTGFLSDDNAMYDLD